MKNEIFGKRRKGILTILTNNNLNFCLALTCDGVFAQFFSVGDCAYKGWW